MTTKFFEEIVFLLLQHLAEEKCNNALHALEKESGVFFNLVYFEEEIHNGNMDAAESYLSGFTTIIDNSQSTKMYFEIRKQKYIEALLKNDRDKALKVLVEDLKIFASLDGELYKQTTQLLTYNNIGPANELTSKYGGVTSTRSVLATNLRILIMMNPMLNKKLQFPTMQNSRLRHLINQSLNWQHGFCETGNSKPEIKTIFEDHQCEEPNSEPKEPIS